MSVAKLSSLYAQGVARRPLLPVLAVAVVAYLARAVALCALAPVLLSSSSAYMAVIDRSAALPALRSHRMSSLCDLLVGQRLHHRHRTSPSRVAISVPGGISRSDTEPKAHRSRWLARSKDGRKGAKTKPRGASRGAPRPSERYEALVRKPPPPREERIRTEVAGPYCPDASVAHERCGA